MLSLRLGIFLLLGSFLSTISTFAEEPLVTRQVINGYEVFIADVKSGNQFGFAWAVPYGTSDDPAQFWGRAHFFEHMVGRGSLKYPGHGTLIDKMKELGYQRNAGTGLSDTTYYAYGHEINALEALDYSLAPLGGVQLEPTSFANEKKTVINEVIDSAPSRPNRALFKMIMSHGLSENHPLHGHQIGTLGTLGPMSPEDLQDLHSRFYQPGIVRLGIFGNFTSGSLTRQQIVDHLQTILPNDRKPVSFAPLTQTQSKQPLFNSERVTRVLEVDGDESDMEGFIVFELPEDANPRAVETFFEILSLPYRGGLKHYLKFDRNWITGLGGLVSRVGPHHIAVIDIEFTEHGFENRDRVVHEITQALELYKTTKTNPDLFASLKQGAEYSLKRQTRKVSSLVDIYPEWMTTKGYEGNLLFNWEQALSSYTPEIAQQGAQALDPKKRMVGFKGNLRQKPEQIDQIYKLPFHTRGLQTFLPTKIDNRLSPANIKVPNLRTAHAPRGQDLGRNEIIRQDSNWTEIYSFDEQWEDRSVILDFQLNKLTLLERLSLQALVFAFKESFQPELFQLSNLGASVNIATGPDRISFVATSDGGQYLDALQWAVSEFARYFQPSNEQLHRFKELKLKAIQGREHGFPGSVTADITKSLFEPDRQLAKDVEDGIRNLDLTKMFSLRQYFMNSRPTLYFAGAFNSFELQQMRWLATEFSPHFRFAEIEPPQRLAVQNEKLAYSEEWIDPGVTGVAATRVYRAPSHTNIKDRVAMSVIARDMHQEIFLKNRPDGYVQGASSFVTNPFDQHVYFYGQANDAESLGLVIRQWDATINKWTSNSTLSMEIKTAKAGVKASLHVKPSSASAANSLAWSNYISTGDPFISNKLRDAIDSVAEADIRRVANEYFAPDRGHLTLFKGLSVPPDCDALLLPDRLAVREKLVVKE